MLVSVVSDYYFLRGPAPTDWRIHPLALLLLISFESSRWDSGFGPSQRQFMSSGAPRSKSQVLFFEFVFLFLLKVQEERVLLSAADTIYMNTIMRAHPDIFFKPKSIYPNLIMPIRGQFTLIMLSFHFWVSNDHFWTKAKNAEGRSLRSLSIEANINQ